MNTKADGVLAGGGHGGAGAMLSHGSHRPETRGSHGMERGMNKRIWLRAPLHAYTRVYVSSFPGIAMGSHACPVR